MSLFNKFIKKEVKATYHDNDQHKVARGLLEETENGFVQITGRLGTIIINEKYIIKMALAKE